MKSKTYEEAEKFYTSNRNNLIKILHNEFQGKIEYQIDSEAGWDQVAVWFDGFSLCYQDSDMNGAGKGEPHWNNDGANCGLDNLSGILENDNRFNGLIAENEYWSNEYLQQLINDFCKDFAEKHNITNYFACNQD